MKILIISTPRSGSTSLMKGLSKVFKLKAFYEPFNVDCPLITPKNFPFQVQNNTIVKSIINQRSLDFYDGYSRAFDKIILLSRIDTQAMYESFLYRAVHTSKGDWHTDYFYEHVNDNEGTRKKIIKCKDKLEVLANTLSLPITWYDNLYSGDRNLIENEFKKWNLAVKYANLKDYINPQNRYRKFNKELI